MQLESLKLHKNKKSRGLLSLLYNGYWVFPGVHRLGRGIDHPLQSSVSVKERVELYPRCQDSTYNYTMSASLYVLSNSSSS